MYPVGSLTIPASILYAGIAIVMGTQSGQAGTNGAPTHTTTPSRPPGVSRTVTYPHPGDDYPWQQVQAETGWTANYVRQCGNYAAWKVGGVALMKRTDATPGNGVHDWKNSFPSDHHATRGSIAEWDSLGSAGHAAYVYSVNADGTITVQEYNFNVPLGYDTRTVPASSPTRYFHF